MPRFQAKGTLARDSIADLWKHTLSRIPTVIGRISYLASLRDPNSGAYKHHGLASVFGREDSTRALRESHEVAFKQWLDMPLPEQGRDLSACLSDLEDPVGDIAKYWLSANHVASLIPDGTRQMEQELFRHDLGTLLQLIRNASGDAQRPKGSTQSP